MKSIHWTFAQMIARESQSVEVHPGEVFGSGTVGTGSILELGTEVHRWLRPDDEVELEIERLGGLRNRIIQSSKSWGSNQVAKLSARRRTSSEPAYAVQKPGGMVVPGGNLGTVGFLR